MVEIADDKPWSYSSSNELGARARGRELYELVRYATSSVGGQVDRTLSTFHQLRTIAATCDRIACLRRTLHLHGDPSGLTPQVIADVFEHDVEDIISSRSELLGRHEMREAGS